MSEISLNSTPMQWVFGDFETHYSKEYSLRHMDPPSYILDDRFEAICLGLAFDQQDIPLLVDGPYIQATVDSWKRKQANGERFAFVSHNALFDACILAWRFGWVPDLIVCTLSMARTLLRSQLKSMSLASVAKHFGLQKGTEIYKAEGMTRADIMGSGFWREYTDYCLNDVRLCRFIFLQLLKDFPKDEIILQDMVLRCALQPQFIADIELLHEHYTNVVNNKNILLIKAAYCGSTGKDELMSNEQFAQLLLRSGVKPPRKTSMRTGKETWAFSKQDREFLALLDHDDPKIATLVEARIGIKTTLEETRALRLINIAQLTFPGYPEHIMPIPLKMAAAITHRLGGDWDCNPQNWGRKSPIRRAMRAPEGHKVVVADSEQIEARLTAWFCGQTDLVDQFARGEDVYAKFAQDTIYHVPVTKQTEPSKRFVGKTGILQLGYQSGPPKFQTMVWLKSWQDEPEPIELSDAEARRIVYGYRNRFTRISDRWEMLASLLPQMCYATFEYDIGPVRIRGNKIIAPGGLSITYRNLRQEFDLQGRLNWVYDYAGATYKIFGGKFLENIIQMLARVVVMQAALRLKSLLRPFGSQLTHTAHDEIVYIVADHCVEQVKFLIGAEMTRTPEWAYGLPLSTSVTSGQTYGEAK